MEGDETIISDRPPLADDVAEKIDPIANKGAKGL
jgi:hypothetical protein